MGVHLIMSVKPDHSEITAQWIADHLCCCVEEKASFCFDRVENMHGELKDEQPIINPQLEKHLLSAIMVLH